MQQAAYDLSTFENRDPRPKLRVAHNPKAKRRVDLSRFKIIATAAVIFSLAWGVLYSRAQITELTTQISSTESDLSDAKSEYDYLNLQLESRTDLDTVENYAVTQLGLVQADPSQITYLTLENEDKVVKPESEVKTFLENLSAGFMNLMEYLAP
ncbi:MAG TPA: cell division protein FtsL [Candidatus Pygmaiobacter gallistercoris]|nr:cell division protein FtsL [Candidatus Pygmaiobacter gallistercoris]